jgi:hypothetical protein
MSRPSKNSPPTGFSGALGSRIGSMADDELRTTAARELRHIDPRFRFWVALCVAKPRGTDASADDVDWTAFDWAPVRDMLEAWLDDLPVDTPESSKPVPVNEELVLVFIATPRSAGAVGYRRMPSFKYSQADPFPPLRFADGDTGSLESMPIGVARELAAGDRTLAIALPSHQQAWQMLAEQMEAQSLSDTSPIHSVELEVYASMLGLVDPPTGPLGDFDEGWRAIKRLDMPIVDDPREDG